MDRPLTDFVRDRLRGAELSAEACDPAWAELRRMAAQELRRRGLWQLSPTCLGYSEPAWQSPGSPLRRGVPSRERDALDELVLDLWAEILERRADYLADRVVQGATLEALVATMVRQQISERQRQQDPLGWHFYRSFHQAIRRLVDGGELRVVAGDPKITNESVLAFGTHGLADLPADDPRLVEVARRWSHELLVPWVSGRGDSTGELVALLVDLSRELGARGFPGFRFKELIDALKHELRRSLPAFHSEPDLEQSPDDEGLAPDVATMGRTAEPTALDHLVERARLDELSDCVERRLRGLDGQQRTRDQLGRLWRLLYAQARGEADPGETRHAKPEALEAILSDELPTHRAMARILDLRHDRVSSLLARLKDEIIRCREVLADSAGGPRATPAGIGSEASMDEKYDLRNELRQRTAAAFAKAGERRAGEGRRAQVGDLVCFREGLDEGIEWLVLPAGDATHWLVPADIVPWRGSRDIEVEGPRGPLVLRFGQSLEVASAAVEDALAEAEGVALDRAEIEALTTFRRQLESESLPDSVDDSARETDSDPDYLDRCGEIEAIARALAERLELSTSPVDESVTADPASPAPLRRIGPKSRPAQARPAPLWLAVAALFALVVTTVFLLRSLDTGRQLEERLAELEAERDAERQSMAEQRERLEAELDALRSEVARLEEAADPVLRERLAAKEAELLALTELAERRAVELAELEAPGVVPKLFAPLGTVRGGDVKTLEVPEGKRRLAIEFGDVEEGDVLEISTENGELLLSHRFEALQGFEATYEIPTSLMPVGERYVVRLMRGRETVSDFELEIIRPESG